MGKPWPSASFVLYGNNFKPGRSKNYDEL